MDRKALCMAHEYRRHVALSPVVSRTMRTIQNAFTSKWGFLSTATWKWEKTPCISESIFGVFSKSVKWPGIIVLSWSTACCSHQPVYKTIWCFQRIATVARIDVYYLNYQQKSEISFWLQSIIIHFPIWICMLLIISYIFLRQLMLQYTTFVAVVIYNNKRNWTLLFTIVNFLFCLFK